MVIPEKFFEIEFNKAMAFGYRTEDVDEFVTKAVEIIKALQEENQELTEKMAVLAESLEKYREDEESLRSALIGAQKLGDSILKDSRSKAEVILRDATTQADHIVEEAHARLERERAEYERLKEEVASFREGLFGMYKSHIDQITKLPHKEKAQQQKAAPPPEAAAPIAAPPAPAPEEPPVKKAPPPAPRKAKRPEPEPEPVDEEEEEIPEPPVKKAPPSKRPAFQLELPDEDDEDDDELEGDDAILSRFSSRFGRRPARQQPADDDFEDDDEDEEEFAPARTVYSPKFGEMRFGEGVELADGREREKGSKGRPKRR